MFDIKSSALRHMLQQVTPHMDDPDNYLPLISSVRLEARSGWLYALATDRYTFAVSRRSIVHDGDHTAHVPGALVPTVMEWLDQAVDSSEFVNLFLPTGPDDEGPIVFSAPSLSTLTIEYDADDYSKFPNWRKLFHSALTAESSPVPCTGVTTKFLSRWPHAAAKLLVFQEAPRKPIVFLDLDGHFAGMQMPINNEPTSRDDVAPEWIAATKPMAAVDGITYDLTQVWEDRDGDLWSYSGNEMPDGMPLMVIEGIEDDPHPLDRLIWTYGPLYAADL